MTLLVAAALAGGAPAVLNEPVWVEADALSPRLCVSMVPSAGPFKKRNAEGWAQVRQLLAAGDVAAAAKLVRGLEAHPAQRSVLGAAYVTGKGVAIDLEPLVERYPDDACLRVLAASAALKENDVQAVSRNLEAALAIWPTNEDVRALSVLVDGPDWEERVAAAIAARPDDPRLRYTIAQLAESRGDTAMAAEGYAKVYAAGHQEVGARLASLALRAGNLDAYLMVATREHPVQIPAVVEAEAKGAAYRSWLGLEGDGDRLDAIIETSKGDLRRTLDVTNAPMTIMSFVGLARGEVAVDGAAGRPFYDGTIFHRVIPDFMIQGGDPEGSGRGGPGFRFDDEPAPRGSFDRPGLMAMANAGPNTNGSQFFVTEVPTPHLSGKHTIFGACDDDSVRLVERIARVKTNDTGRPTEDVVIEHIRFEVVPR